MKRIHYWSDRLVAETYRSYSIPMERDWNFKITSPGMGVLPQVEGTRNQNTAPLDKIAARLVRELDQIIGNFAHLDQNMPLLQGNSMMAYGEFPGERPDDLDTCVMFTGVRDVGQRKTALCLFGSMHNLSGYLREYGPKSRGGWTSSSFPQINAFVRQRCQRPIGNLNYLELVVRTFESVFAGGQIGRDSPWSFRPWNRGFTYGDMEVDWLAHVHCDVSLREADWPNPAPFGFERIVIASPLWIRGETDAVRRYSEWESVGPEESNRARRLGESGHAAGQARRRNANPSDWIVD